MDDCESRAERFVQWERTLEGDKATDMGFSGTSYRSAKVKGRTPFSDLPHDVHLDHVRYGARMTGTP